MASQGGECVWLDHEQSEQMIRVNGSFFRSAEYASIQVSTYPCGQISAFVASKNQITCSLPLRKPVSSNNGNGEEENIHLKYYSPKMHEAAFVLPAFREDKLLSNI